MRRYIFNLKNVKTYPHEVYDKKTVELYGIPKKICDTYIDYGDFKVYMKIDDSYLFEFKTNIKWVHPASSHMGEKYHYNNICLGQEYTDQIRIVIRNKTNERQLIEHILYDYFSTCTEDHWQVLKVPAGLKSITNDDLFECRYYHHIYHISNMGKKICGASINFENSHLCQIQLSDNENYPINIDNYIICDYCGAISKPTNKKCHECSDVFYNRRTVKNEYT